MDVMGEISVSFLNQTDLLNQNSFKHGGCKRLYSEFEFSHCVIGDFWLECIANFKHLLMRYLENKLKVKIKLK